jgi:hypothetical protein
MVEPTATRSPTNNPVIFNIIYNCYGKRKDPLSCKVSDYAYKPRTSEQTMNECNSGLHDLLSDMEYLTSRGLWSRLSSNQFKNVQDKYQLPTDFNSFNSTEAHATATAFEVGCDYWSAIHVDDDYYYTTLSCVAEKVNDRSILFYFCFPTYGMAIPMYSGSVISFNPHLHHGCTDPTEKMLEFLVHMYQQEHATRITHLSILSVQFYINVNDTDRPHITLG